MGRLSQEQVEQYARDGVIHLPGALRAAWIEPVRPAVERVVESGKSFGLTIRPWATDEESRRFAFDTGLAELAAEATRSHVSTSIRSS